MWPFLKPIPNFHEVKDNIWRGGQPTKKGWLQLQDLGVRFVVKLNTDEEGIDTAPGMLVKPFPIDVRTQITGDGLSGIIPQAVAAIAPFTFIHCGSDARTQSELDVLLNTQGGQDRTGLVCACYRIKCGWSFGEAEREMLAAGFHKFPTIGLWEYWERYRATGAYP